MLSPGEGFLLKFLCCQCICQQREQELSIVLKRVCWFCLSALFICHFSPQLSPLSQANIHTITVTAHFLSALFVPWPHFLTVCFPRLVFQNVFFFFLTNCSYDNGMTPHCYWIILGWLQNILPVFLLFFCHCFFFILLSFMSVTAGVVVSMHTCASDKLRVCMRPTSFLKNFVLVLVWTHLYVESML